MPVPADRYQILPARGNYSDLAAEVASLGDGEICYAVDQDQYYQNEGGTLVAVGATKVQGLLAESALQPGDNVSELVNDAGYITAAEVPPSGVTQIIAGNNVSITPSDGTGAVTINASASGETGGGVLDGGDFDTGVDTTDGTAQLDGGLFT